MFVFSVEARCFLKPNIVKTMVSLTAVCETLVFSNISFSETQKTQGFHQSCPDNVDELCVFKHLMFENIGNARVSTKLSGQL